MLANEYTEEMVSGQHFNSLFDLLKKRANHQPDKIAFRYLQNDLMVAEQATYADLLKNAVAIANHLCQIESRHKTAILCFEPGISFIQAFTGCVISKTIAVPTLYPSSKRHYERFIKIIKNSQANLCLCHSRSVAKLRRILSEQAPQTDVQFISVDLIDDEAYADDLFDDPDPKQIACLQYTSGTMGTPKGVVITHGNLLANLQVIHNNFELKESDKGVFWLPATHDMGLIGGILTPIFAGGESTLLDPIAFAENPLLWLQAVTDYRATITGAPNFALDYCVDRISAEAMQTLDLSSLEILFCGAERVRVKTLERFGNQFEVVGFERQSLLACYGMAETTLMVSATSKNLFPNIAELDNQLRVSCGLVHASYECQIVDPYSEELVHDGQVGEICLSGASVSPGYWGETLDQNRILRTGDLGIIDEGELFVVGRVKELIIHNGINYYAADLQELIEQSHPAIAPQGVAVLQLDDGESEEVVVIGEIRRTHRKTFLKAVGRAIRSAVNLQFQLPIKTTIFIKPGRLPRTASGKISRHQCQQQFKTNQLVEMGRIEQSETILASNQPVLDGVDSNEYSRTTQLKIKLSQLLNLSADQIDPERPIVDYGLDSLKAAQLNSAITEIYGVAAPLELFGEVVTLNDIAEKMSQLQTNQKSIGGKEIMPQSTQHLFDRARQFDGLNQARAQDISLPYFRTLSSNDGPTCELNGKTLLMFGSNNYLGLTTDLRVREATAKAAQEFGPSTTGSRLLNGTFIAHRELEQKLAAFLGKEDALVFTTGYQANIGLLSALLTPESTFFVDERCHASIYDGAFVARANIVQFAHNNPDNLAQKLEDFPQNGAALIMIDGVYSMEGHIGQLDQISAIAKTKNVPVLVDDAHALGMLGKTGRGTEEHFGSAGYADLISGTFSKSLASIGGWVAGDADILEWIKFNGRSMVFSASMSPPAVAAASCALDILMAEPERVSLLMNNVRRWRSGLLSLGYDIGADETAVVPIHIGDEMACLKMNQALIDAGIYTNATIFPAVPKGEALLRTSVMATHSKEHIDLALNIFADLKPLYVTVQE
ncbi:MAG: aminotransferase class I/II-fold pyridoxal phosphate-dependent enzyme [Chloroflexota bacterium]